MMKRIFYPGDEWLFFKIYASPSMADNLLIQRLWPYVRRQIRLGRADKWFFIRYSDPGHHIRLRLHTGDTSNLGSMTVDLNNALRSELHSGAISRVVIDTYVREVERYGCGTMEECERLFCSDSDKTVKFLSKTTDETERLVESVRKVNDCLCGIGMELGERKNLMERLSKGYAREFGLQDKQTELTNLYKKLIPRFEEIVNSKGITNEVVAFGWLAKSRNRDDLLASLLHMSINRMFPDNQRKYEYIVYAILLKIYCRMIYSDN